MGTSSAEIPNRDASAAIRGYGYQIDHTIMRWLDLRDSEILELECGEDIDLVAPLLDDARVPSVLLGAPRCPSVPPSCYPLPAQPACPPIYPAAAGVC